MIFKISVLYTHNKLQPFEYNIRSAIRMTKRTGTSWLWKQSLCGLSYTVWNKLIDDITFQIFYDNLSLFLVKYRYQLKIFYYHYNLKMNWNIYNFAIVIYGTHQVLAYADDVNDDIRTIERNADLLLNACKDIGLELNTGKTKYMEIGRHRGMIVSAHIKIDSYYYQKVKTFKY